MIHFQLTEIVTKDDLVHQGIFYKPAKLGKKAVLWMHGLSGNFYSNVTLMAEFRKQCEQFGFGFASFNNRGHDLISGLRKIDSEKPKGYTHAPGGAGQEIFENCVYDIDAGVDFLVKQGFKEVILVGHSTGANKICYYAGTTINSHVSGIILASPLSDRLNPEGLPPWWGLFLAKFLMIIGRGDRLITGYSFFPGTPKRFLSLFTPRSNEDTFDYGDKNPEMKSYSKIKKPLLIILSGADESMDRPAEKIKSVFDTKTTAQKYKSIIIPHASHNFNGKEKEFVKRVIDWIVSI